MDIVFEMTKKMISSSNHRQVAEERHRSSRRWLGGCGGNLFVREGIPGITIHLWIGQSTHSARPPRRATSGWRAAAAAALQDLGSRALGGLFDRSYRANVDIHAHRTARHARTRPPDLILGYSDTENNA